VRCEPWALFGQAHGPGPTFGEPTRPNRGGGATRVRGWIVRPAGRGRPWCLSHKPPHPGAASTGGAALPFRREVPARSVAAAAPAAASVQHHQGDDEQGGKHCRRDKPWSSVAGCEIAHVDHLPWNPCPPRRHPCAAKVATSPTLGGCPLDFGYGDLASPGSASGTRLTTSEHRPRIRRKAVHARRSRYDESQRRGTGHNWSRWPFLYWDRDSMSRRASSPGAPGRRARTVQHGAPVHATAGGCHLGA